MLQGSINQDQFLQREGVEVEGSDFLSKILQNKQQGIKQEYNLLDVHGRRLSRYWNPGDSFLSVVKKRCLTRISLIFDPDTYTQRSVSQVREYLVRQKVKLLGVGLTLMLPFSLYYHFLRPRIARAKRLYIMQFYNKMGFLSKQLGVKTTPVSEKDLKNSL